MAKKPLPSTAGFSLVRGLESVSRDFVSPSRRIAGDWRRLLSGARRWAAQPCAGAALLFMGAGTVGRMAQIRQRGGLCRNEAGRAGGGGGGGDSAAPELTAGFYRACSILPTLCAAKEGVDLQHFGESGWGVCAQGRGRWYSHRRGVKRGRLCPACVSVRVWDHAPSITLPTDRPVWCCHVAASVLGKGACGRGLPCWRALG